MRAANKQREFDTRKAAVTGPSFKKFLRTIRDAANRRLILEKSLLLEAFAVRGSMGYKDYVIAAEPIPKAIKRQQEQAAKEAAIAKAVAAANASHGNGAEVGGGSGDVGFGEDDGGEGDGKKDDDDDEPGVGEEGSQVTVANETNFSDKAVWGGYMLSEVNVFYEQNQGIMGITATAKVRRGGRRKERKRERERERERERKLGKDLSSCCFSSCFCFFLFFPPDRVQPIY